MKNALNLTMIVTMILAATLGCKTGALSKFTEPKSKCAVNLPPLDSASKYSERGMNEINEGNYECAFDDCQKAIDAGGKNAETLTCRGIARFKRKEFDAAEKDLNEAINLEPNNPGTLYQRADLYRETKQFGKALVDMNKLIELMPAHYQYAFRAKIYADSGDYENAAKDYTEAIRLAPQKALYYRERAAIYREFGKKDLAAADEKKYEEFQTTE